MLHYDVVIVGGGPAGLAAATAAYDAGTTSILILERDNELGGILNQCIHNGFGLHTFKEELTGPEYAARYIDKVRERGIEYRLDTMVMNISADRVVTAMNREDGLFDIEAGAVILAMGCRERPRGALNIPGYRPAGIYSAGTAQRLVNMEGYLPGRDVVILGSGDIGLIMARRMTLEGAHVHVVAELMPYSGGLKRNIVQCLDDYGIPLKLSHTVVNIEGRDRVRAVTIAAVDENRRPIPGTEERYPCDTLLLSTGLIPENELTRGAGAEMDGTTNGPIVNERLETTVPGVFACGNVLHVHDLVDWVSQEAAAAGHNAALYVQTNGSAEGDYQSFHRERKAPTPVTQDPQDGRTLTCIGCPRGCTLTATIADGEVTSVTGNHCPIGDRYARQEILHPERTVTSTVVITGGSLPRVSVKTAGNIPKGQIADCMDAINHVKVQAPVHIGDVIIENVCGTGVNVVATANSAAANATA